MEDDDSVFYYYQRLIQLRHESELIVYGSYEAIDPEDNEVFAYRRHYNGQTLLVLSNFTDRDVVRDYGQRDAKQCLISNYDDDQGDQLRPYETKVFLFQ